MHGPPAPNSGGDATSDLKPEGCPFRPLHSLSRRSGFGNPGGLLTPPKVGGLGGPSNGH